MNITRFVTCREQRTFGRFTWHCIRYRHVGGHYMRALRIEEEEDPMPHLPAGHVMEIEGLPGRWQVWSQSGNSPGAYFFVPSSGDAWNAGIKFVEVRVTYPKNKPKPITTVLDIHHRSKT